MEIKKQAVVLIHGIGEQKPMDTLREFVDGLKKFFENNYSKDFKNKEVLELRSKPDRVFNNFETRKLSLGVSVEIKNEIKEEIEEKHKGKNSKIKDYDLRKKSQVYFRIQIFMNFIGHTIWLIINFGIFLLG